MSSSQKVETLNPISTFVVTKLSLQNPRSLRKNMKVLTYSFCSATNFDIFTNLILW